MGARCDGRHPAKQAAASAHRRVIAAPSLDAAQWAALPGKPALVLAGTDSPGLPMAQVLDPEHCVALLDELGPRIGSPSRAITASMLGKRYAFLATGAFLYAMSVYDQALDLSLGNVLVDPRHDGKLWRSHLLLRDSGTHAAPEDATQRLAWRDAAIERLFGVHLASFWTALCAASRLAPRILWENTAVRVYALYEGRMPDDATPAQRARIDADFAYLVGDAPGSLFGLDHNPLARYFHPRTRLADEDRSVRFRKTCCLYYMLPAGEYCRACPLDRKKR